MTDKVQKIKEWISKEQDGLMDAQGNFEYPEHEGAYHILCNLDAYIDSLQEEPCNSCQGFNDKDKCDELVFTHNCPIVKNPVSIWHDASEKSNEPEEVVIINPSDNTGDVLTRCTGVYQGRIWAYTSELLNLDNSCNIGKNLQEEPVSEELEEAAKNIGQKYFPDEDNIWARPNYEAVKAECAFKAGAKWQKEQMMKNIWKPADGDDLPEYEREVVVFTQNYPNDAGMMSVAIGHRPIPEGYDGKSLTTGEVEHYIPKTNGKGGWNIPDVKWWLDCSLPNMEKG